MGRDRLHLFRQQQNFHKAGGLVHLVLTWNIGLGLRPRLTFAATGIPARCVLNARANSAAVREDTEYLLIAELTNRWSKLGRGTAGWRQIDLDLLVETVDHTHIQNIKPVRIVDRDF